MANNEINQVVVNGNTYTIASTDTNLAPVETNANSASKSYAVGDHLVVSNTYCKVIAAISTGDALVKGTNIQSAKVGDEIKKNSERIAGLGYKNGTCSNALLVTRTNFDASNNRCDYVLSGSTSNLPSDCLVGIREVIPMDNEGSTGRVIVRILGLDSNSKPAMWINVLNTSAWTGWKKVGGSMKVLAYGTTRGTKTISLGTTLDPSKYMVTLNTNGYAYTASDGAASWAYGYGQGAYVSAKTNTSVTIVVSATLTASYEIIQIAD